LKRWRSHRGVDYAAASGTPVHATADGIVTRVANERGYGKVIMLQHFNIYTTVYAHLRAFRKGIKRGKRVKQGDVIGYVGQTGLATGPHLHYEFRIRGKHKNPLSAILPKQLPALKDKPLARFQQYSNALFSELDSIAIRT
ncbi:MAG: M23 family metallopeptidase, partial [Proteobacteria bacterium]|nr:M23 family metallopeptidase [Pseudomonadota bacterium]